MKDNKATGWKGGQYKPFSSSEVKKICDGAIEILSRAGMFVGTKTGFEAFKAAGLDCSEDTRIVKFTRAFIEDKIAGTPHEVVLYGREDGRECNLSGSQVHVGTGGTALYVLDPETGEHRPSTLVDVAGCAKLCDALENIHLFTINVFPNEIKDVDKIDVNRFFWSLKNTSKHVMGGVYSMAGTKQVVEMCEMIAGGADALREKPFVSFITLIISPFKIDERYGEVTCYLAERGLPVVTPTEPICGTTSPVTLASNVLMHITETIAGVLLVQSVRKGAPVICGSVGSITNLRSMHHVSGAVERGMIHAGVSQVAQHLQIPLYSTSGTSDAKIVDAQAAYESAISNLLVTMSGANYIHDACGLMDLDLTVSYEKMVMDDEILGMCSRVLRGIEVTDDTLAVDLMCQLGPGKNYMAEEHTIKYMRDEFFKPKIADRDLRAAWKANGAKDATLRAKEHVKEIQAEYKPLGLPEQVESAIRERFDILEPA